MKKMTRLFALALLACAVVSCGNDDNDPSIQKVAVQFGGSINVTRAVNDAWTSGDQIGIFMVDADKVLSAEAISEGADNVAYQTDGSGVFSPIANGKTIYFPMDGNVDFYAYYPYSTVSNYKVALNVTDQTNQEAIDFMYAKTAGCNKAKPQVALKFDHQLTNLILEIQPGDGLTQEELAKLTIKVKGQNTTATYNLVDGLISDEGNPADITMKTTEAGKKYEAILLPTTEESRDIEFNLNNDHDAPFVWTMPTKLDGGNKYHYTVVKLSRTAIEVSGTITPWNEMKDENENIAK